MPVQSKSACEAEERHKGAVTSTHNGHMHLVSQVLVKAAKPQYSRTANPHCR
jgi:hypothetical protein